MELMGLFSGATPAAATTTLGVTSVGAAWPIAGASGAAAASAGIPWGAILQGAAAGSSLLGGLAGFQSGQANAAYLDAASKQALEAGAANKSIAESKARAQLGELHAQMGAQGTTASGSPMLVYLDSVKNAALESANEYYQGKLRSVGLKSQARISRLGGQADLFKGFIGAGSSLLLR
jgi:hypothetical protein